MSHISVTYSCPPAYSFHMLLHASYLSHIQLPSNYSFHMLLHASYLSHIQLPSSLQLPYAPPCLISQSHTVALQPTASICSSMPHISVTYSCPPAYSFHMLLHASYLSHIQLPSSLQLPYAPPCLISQSHTVALQPTGSICSSMPHISVTYSYPPAYSFHMLLHASYLSHIQLPSSLQLPYAPPCLISQSHTVTLQPTASIYSSMPHISVTYSYPPITASICSSMPHISVTYSCPPAYSFHMLLHASYLSHIQLPSSLQLPYAPPCLISQSHTVALQPTAYICSSMPHISVTYSHPPAYRFHILLHASYLSHIQLPSSLQLPYAPPCLISQSHTVTLQLKLPYTPPCLISQSHTVALQPTASICSSMPHISVTYSYPPITASIYSSMPHISVTYSHPPAYRFHILLHASYLSHIQLPSNYSFHMLLHISISVTYSYPPTYSFHLSQSFVVRPIAYNIL